MGDQPKVEVDVPPNAGREELVEDVVNGRGAGQAPAVQAQQDGAAPVVGYPGAVVPPPPWTESTKSTQPSSRKPSRYGLARKTDKGTRMN